MPPSRLALLVTAFMAKRTSPRKLAPMPLWTTVAPSLIELPVTPTSVDPPFCPAAHPVALPATAVPPAAVFADPALAAFVEALAAGPAATLLLLAAAGSPP